MRLLWSRTVTKRLTRLTWLRITGPCCASCCRAGRAEIAGSAEPRTKTEATSAVRAATKVAGSSFFTERMYTFLEQSCPARNDSKLGWYRPVRCRDMARGMRGSKSRQSQLKRRKFGPTMKKSPRKTVLAAGVALLLAPLAFMAAQNPVKPPKPNPDSQTQPAPTQPTQPPAQTPANRPGENPARMSDTQARITVN